MSWAICTLLALCASPGVEPLAPAPGEASAPAPAVTMLSPPAVVRTTRRSPALPGLGAKLARRLRDGPLVQDFWAKGLEPEQIEAEGGVILGRVGPILSARATRQAIVRLASRAIFIEAPATLRPALDEAVRAIRADDLPELTEQGDTPSGRNILIGMYDTGIDLQHPDFSDPAGPRILGLWDRGRSIECDASSIRTAACASDDPDGHGTHVASVAAGDGERYRGLAPSAGLLVVADPRLDDFLSALAWLDAKAIELDRPMVVNLSLGGHEGPHDGSSLGCQAIDALPHLVVAAAGNDGERPAHARATLGPSSPTRTLGLSLSSAPPPVSMVVEAWTRSAALSVGLVLVRSGEIIAASSTVAPGDSGRTEPFVEGDGGPLLGMVSLDAEPIPNPDNGKYRLRLELELERSPDSRSEISHFAVRIAGEGEIDLWTDAPAESPPSYFARPGELGRPDELAADSVSSISDLSTAKTAISVSSFVSRRALPDGTEETLEIGALSRFSSYGPSLAPERVGPKPDLAGPGEIVIAARSQGSTRTSIDELGLYTAGRGTSVATPAVAGIAAILLELAPATDKAELAAWLLDGAAPAEQAPEDERWGAGRLDARGALSEATGLDLGCGCRASGKRLAPPGAPWWILLALALAWRVRPRGA